MGAIETAMIDAGYAAVGRSLGLPTHAYLGATDAKVVDAQAGLEAGMTALVGGLAGIDLISGPGMLDFLLLQSAEKLVIDAEVIGMVQRLLRGIGTPTETLATGFFEAAGPDGRFLELQDTRRLFRGEQFLPSPVIDRSSRRAWLDARRPRRLRSGPRPRRRAARGPPAAGPRSVGAGATGGGRPHGRRRGRAGRAATSCRGAGVPGSASAGIA